MARAVSVMRIGAMVGIAGVALAQPAADTLVYVTQVSGTGGAIYKYTGGAASTAIATGCSALFRDVIVVADTVYVSSPTQIYKTALSPVSAACGTALISPPNSNYDIAHIAADDNWVYFTERTSGSVRRVPVAGGADSVVLADGTDGIAGKRLGVSLVGSDLIYTARGTDSSNPATARNCICQTSTTPSSPSTQLFCYGSNRAWWLSDITISTSRGVFIGAELRNDSVPATNNIQRSTWPLANLSPLETNIQDADEDNTYITLDEGAMITWYTNAHTNEISTMNATARFVAPISRPFMTVPSSQGVVHGLAFVLGTASHIDYCTPPAAGNPCALASPSPSANPAPSAGTSASPGGSGATPSASPSGGQDVTVAAFTAAVAAVAVALVARAA